MAVSNPHEGPLGHEAADALLSPDAYDEPVADIRVIQTHISFVFLTGDYAYKIKKPVDFGFLDYTTLDKRRFYCREELRVNRRLCPDIYLGVVPLNRSEDGSIKVNGPGETVEYAVKMVQLPQEAIMTRLLDAGEVTDEDMVEVAGILADFHARAATGEGVDEYGGYRQIKANWVENFEQTRALRGGVLDAGAFDALEGYILDFMEDNRALFRERVEAGRVRECHGDCHGGNIFIIREGTGRYGPGIYIFDAIEFNRAFSCSDVASEVAFLAMDLEFKGHRGLAEVFVREYIEKSGDTGLPELLDFYKCYRAYVRAKVIGFKLFDPAVGPEEKKESQELTGRYFRQALAYAGL
ncbi:MAG: hypothetical protein GXO65_01700 [Euryarchaeota archaeon]|nr:hypothetical protein [Euryarchaeota archaeon]